MANSREQIVKNYLRTKLHVKGTDTPVYRLLDILATPDGDVSEIVNRYSALENKALRKSFHDVATLLRSLEKGSSVTAGTKTLRLDTPIIETPTCDISSLPKIKIFVDGCSKGNPGPCGAAFVMKDMEDTTVFEGNRYLGEGTNNWSEYQAMIFALEKAREHNARNLLVFSDSELIINQLKGVYKIKNKTLFGLSREVRKLRKSFESVQFFAVLRTANKRADKLAGVAVKAHNAKNEGT